MKKIIIVVMLFVAMSSQAQVIIKKDQIRIYAKDERNEYQLVNTTNEDMVISIKETNLSYKIVYQRNSIAKNGVLWAKKDEIIKRKGHCCLICDRPSVYVTVNKNKLSICFETYALSVKMTDNERKRLLKYLESE